MNYEKGKYKENSFWTTLTALGGMIVVDMIGESKICGVGSLICREKLEDLFVFLYSIPVLLLFSLITYKMREQVFHAWWNFARWWVPVIAVATVLLNNAGGTGGGYIGMGQAFIFLILGILYAILVIVCLIKIVRAYHQKQYD